MPSLVPVAQTGSGQQPGLGAGGGSGRLKAGLLRKERLGGAAEAEAPSEEAAACRTRAQARGMRTDWHAIVSCHLLPLLACPE